ncbi:hypothetical protein J3R83DRAFT_11583 [Lanmaoa asiatica]|nr:hypothetical protein J3R83DRAFT_11583 [Lanmaoa asiatica]
MLSPSTFINVWPITHKVVPDGGKILYQSVNKENSLDNKMDIDALPFQHNELDLAYSIKGMYRILDLISEQGSGGLIDKIIISQNSLEAFINSVCPDAYSSMTKVNFKALDKYAIKPIGVYRSKEEIVRFLLQLGAINDTMYVIWLGSFILYISINILFGQCDTASR